jgi:two-component system CheB/CheR fusion protein
MDDGAALEGRRILLLEDDTDARESMAMLLEVAGASVVSTPTAEDALAALQRSEFDAVVTDVAMPGRSGFWLVGQIRQLPSRPTVPVLAVTGHPFPRDGMLRAGFDDQMLKPVSPHLLYRTLTQLMQRGDATTTDRETPTPR